MSSLSMDNSSAATKFCRGLVETPLGMLHYKFTGSLNNDAASSSTLPILAFHMSPRSTDEYTEVMPLLSTGPASLPCQHVDDHHRRLTETTMTTSCQRRLVVAIDEPGYGDSDNPRHSCTLDEIAHAYMYVANHLGIQEFVVTGSFLMGCYIALSLASSSRHAHRVKAVICTNLYYYPHDKHIQAVQQEHEKQQHQQQQQQFPTAIADSWEMHEDGSHLMTLWNQRSSWLNAELNSRVVLDELTYLLKRRQRYAQGGIHIQNGAAFDLEHAAKNVTCPVLIIMGTGAMQFFDTIGFAMSSQLELAKQLFPTIPLQVMIEQPGSINLLNQNHHEWTRAVLQFLEDHVESK